MGDWKQERPEWCPHQDCGFCARSQDFICIGELPQSLDHDGVANTHRLCTRGAKDDGLWLHQVEWNRGDAWNFRRIIDLAFAFNAGRLSVGGHGNEWKRCPCCSIDVVGEMQASSIRGFFRDRMLQTAGDSK